MAWDGILEAVNKQPVLKITKNNWKEKNSNLKAKYKAAKENNKKFKNFPFFEELDSVLGTRDVMTMPGAQSDGHNDVSDYETSETVQDQRRPLTESQNKRIKRNNDIIIEALEKFQEMQEEQTDKFVAKMDETD